MNDYKKTLNLPHTLFPMKANLAEREPAILKKWQDEKLYQTLRDQSLAKKKFILHAGPPYANGHIHLGHATNNILKDIIVKAKTLDGFNAPLVPGWDCHGLPIELNVEKKVGKPGVKVSPEAFRHACRDFANTFIDIQREEFKRLGMIADWDHPYLTMDPTYEANIIRSLANIISHKHLQKGYKPVHWCLDCASALAEAEVEYIEKTSPSIDVRFKVADPLDFHARFNRAIPKKDISIPIWTTTPWTLPGNEAVALNGSLDYVLIATEDEYLLIADALKDSVFSRYDLSQHQELGKIRGESLEGLILKHPFYDKTVPVILGDHVTVDSGTGAVHTAPAHGQDDYVVGKKYQLPMENPVANNGCYTDKTPLFAGLHVSKANEKIITVLTQKGMLLHEESLNHSYPHCWRHKTPLIFRATPQWFISMDQNGLRQSALDAISKVKWIPERGEVRIKTMIEGRPDWCISRQRTWGVPITLFIHKDTGDLHPDTPALIEKVATFVEKEGLEAWFKLDPKTLLGAEAETYQKVSDVLDVWFDSGVSHECVVQKRPELHFPSDLVLEGSDQHRGWFQTSLLTSVAMNGKAPFKQVLTHGFVLDGQGRKMSKSLGNVISPQEVIQSMGADILRLWVGSVDYRNDINASKEILNRMTEAYRRIRNTARFMLANLHDFDPNEHLVPEKEMLALDRFALSQAYHLQNALIEAYDGYQFHQIIQKLQNYCITDLGGFYLDIIKDRQYTMAKESLGRRSAQTALYHILEAMVRWMAPILSFTAEEIWEYLPGKRPSSVFLVTWYKAFGALYEKDEMNDAYWEKIRLIRDAVNKEIENKRNEGKLGSALEADVSLYCGPTIQRMLDLLQDELRFVLIVSNAKVIPEHAGPLDAIVTDVPGLSLKVETTTHTKCIRCWHRSETVDQNPNYPGLCARCVENVGGQGEKRHYA